MCIIRNNVTKHDNSSLFAYQPTVNPLDKLVEDYKENNKLYALIVLAEKVKFAYLEELLKKS